MIAYTGFLKLEWSEQDAENFIDSDLPKEVFISYCQIGHVYGAWAGDFWKYTAYYKDEGRAEQSFAATEASREQVRRALANNFAIPPDPERDQMILDRYLRIRKNFTELERRSDISERRKDFFAYFGGASMVGIVAFFVGRSAKQQTTRP